MSDRELLCVDSSNHSVVQEALEDALFRDGPAVLPSSDSKASLSLGPVPRDTALVVETSGSTSRPKRVWHTESSLRSAAHQVNDALGLPGVWWQVLPTHYIAGVMVLVRALYSKSSVVLAEASGSLVTDLLRFDQEASSDSEGSPRYTSLVPKQLGDLLDAAESDSQVKIALQRFSRILVGGQAVSNALLERAERTGLKVTKTYGSAETAGGCVWDGAPLKDTVVYIDSGRVAVAGPMLAGGYLGDPDRTAESFQNRRGKKWFLSDDCGEWVNGILTVTGRIDRTIISGGEKVNLDEVESLLMKEYPDREWALVGVPDQKWGQAIAVVTSEAAEWKFLQQTVRDSFGPAARIASTHTLTELPRLGSGKVDRVSVERLAGLTQSTAGEG